MDKTVKTYGDIFVEGLKTFQRFIVRKSDGSVMIKAGDGFNGVEINGLVIPVSTEPATPVTGQVYFDGTTIKIYTSAGSWSALN